jgi:hypothetical protein
MAYHHYVLVLLHALLCAGRIIDYRTTKMAAAAVVGLPRGHWASYDDETHLGSASAAGRVDDTSVLDPVGFSIPFYGLPAAPLFIDSNGFISPVPYSMCDQFCPPTATTGYQYSSVGGVESGGNWPLIGLYVADLDPTNSLDANIYKRIVENKYGDGQSVAIVEYREVRQYSTASDKGTALTCQAELFANGTIILRYKSVVRRFVAGNATVGLVFAPQQRIAVPTPTVVNDTLDIAAYRFDPVNDTCDSPHATCSSCVASAGCQWCASQSACINATLIGLYCDAADVQRNVSLCNATPSTNADDAVQYFYSQTVLPSDNVDQTLSKPPPRIHLRLSAANQFPFRITLPFNYSFFDFPMIGTESASTDVVTLHTAGSISVFGNDDYCSVRQVLCTDHAIAPLLTNDMEAMGDSTWLTVTDLPERAARTAMCGRELANVGGRCAAAVLIELRGLHPRSTSNMPSVMYSVAVLLEASGRTVVALTQLNLTQGNASLRIPGDETAGNPLLAMYPTPVLGLMRSGVADTSSAVLPLSNLRGDVVALFTPIRGCRNCRGRGTCDPTTFTCRCGNTTMGADCGACVPGFYGAACTRCPKCLNGGRCDDGATGTGKCRCEDPWSGATCDVLCTASDPRPLNCPSCHTTGGTCLCGRCSCNVEMGWSGAECSSWADPCAKLSFDGCQTCIVSRVPRCVFCGVDEFRCAADASQNGVPAMNSSSRCRYVELDVTSFAKCPRFRYSNDGDAGGPSLFVMLAIFLAVAFLICIGVFVMWCCRPLTPNPMVVTAVAGIPNARRPRRERELVQVSPCGKITGPVQAVPLRQIALADLYPLQQQRMALSRRGGRREDE